MSDPVFVLGFEPEDLDGHSIDELTDYLERGRTPADPSIEGSPACRNALRALERLRDLARDYLDVHDDAPTSGQSWISTVLASIPVDARPGRRFPVPSADPDVTVHVTEGAVRGLIRAIGDDVPGLLVGAVRLGADEPTPVSIDVALVYGEPLERAVEVFRAELRSVLPEQVPFAIGSIDIHVIGVIDAPAADGTAP